MPSDGKSSHCLWQGEIKKKSENTFFLHLGASCCETSRANTPQIDPNLYSVAKQS
jgi:hypothetical protein